MIETIRVLVPQIVTPTTVNAQIDILNGEYGSSVQHIPTGGVLNAWNIPLLDLPRPSIGYDIGWNADGVAQLIRNGKNRMTLPVWFYVIAPTGLDKETALQHLGITFEALMYVMDQFPPNGAEQKTVTGVSPVRVLTLLGDPTIRSFTVDALAAGKVPGLATKWDFTIDTARS